MSNNGTMVCCLACKQVVWAYDAPLGDVRGLLNMMRMPCRLCGARGNYDGWSVTAERVEALGCADAWMAMRSLAVSNGFRWSPSLDNVWFDRPEGPA